MSTAAHDSSTDLSLIESLAQGNPASKSWPVFVAKYGRLIYRWCRHWKAAPEEAEDVVQETLIAVFRRLETYQKLEQSKFRSWLKTIAYRIWLEINRAHQLSQGQITGESAKSNSYELLMTIEARDDLIKLFDEMATQEIFDLACKRVSSRVEANQWQCFEHACLKQLSGKQVGDELQMSEGAVFTATSRVRKRVRDKVVCVSSRPETGPASRFLIG